MKTTLTLEFDSPDELNQYLISVQMSSQLAFMLDSVSFELRPLLKHCDLDAQIYDTLQGIKNKIDKQLETYNGD